MSDTEEKKVPQEFREKVLSWLEIDDKLRELRAKTKELNDEKKQHEEFIIESLQQLDEDVLDIKDGKLRKNVSKTKAPIKKDLVYQSLFDKTNDKERSSLLTKYIFDNRPTKERVYLKRTKNRGPRKKN
jgi:hypothetical protein